MTEPILEPAARTPTDIFIGPEGLRPGWGILLYIVLLLSLGSALSFLAHKAHHPPTHPATEASHPETSPTSLAADEGLSLLVVLLTTFTLARIERRPFTTYGLAAPHRLPHFLQGLLFGTLCLSLLVALLHLTGHLPIDARLLSTPTALRYGATWAIAFTLVAFLEETLLRGYLQYTLTRGLRALFPTRHHHAVAFWTSALLLSFVFGLGHTTNPGESPIGLLSAGLAGLVFSLALYRTGSLWWALGFHAAWDWAQSFLYGVPDSGSMVQHHLLATHPTGPPILSGGLTGPEGSIFVIPTLALAAAIIYVTLPQAKPEI